MKTMGKILLSVFIVGFIVCFIGLAAAGFSFKNLATGGEYKKKEWNTTEKVRSVFVDVGNADVTLFCGESEGIRVAYDENDLVKYELGTVDGTLRLTSVKVPWHKQIFRFSTGAPKVGIYLGEEYFAEGAGFEKITLKSDNGDIHSEVALFSDTLHVETDNGDVTVSEISVKNSATVTSDNGDVTVKNLTAGENVSAETDNGNVKLENVTAGGKLGAETNNGNVKGVNVVAGFVAFFSDNGNVTATGVTSASIELETDNGNVHATINGRKSDYKISASAELGKCNIASTTEGNKTLKVETETGNVEVAFTE
ncbi:MAG: DUF4097 family beta strand repeat protein [Clostridia bacterium]|nr:DUF4097 family beta strand repeat protein [Clostridia bacterium]